MKKTKKKKNRFTYGLILPLLFLCLISVNPAWAMDSHTPFFAGQTGLPNVMVIFDNSDSMQDSPYKKKDGGVWKPHNHQWKKGVLPTSDTDPSCTAGAPCIDSYPDDVNQFKDEQGNVITELTLPGQNPPNLPGLHSNVSSVTPNTTPPADSEYNGTDCVHGDSSKKCSNRIYDSSVDWTAWTDLFETTALSDGDIFNQRYENWKVKVTEKSTGLIQVRSLVDYDSAGYWEVDGDPLEYTRGKYYTYKLVVGLPGRVTRKSTDNNKIFDRNFNWKSVVRDQDFHFMYNGKTLEITAGTNAGESRTITGRNIEEGYWIVNSSFSAASDLTSRYKIEADSPFITGLTNKRAYGGDHPASKMYKAKLALRKFLESEKIRQSYTNPHTGVTSDRYLLNIGFATFMQAAIPRTVALYYRKIAAVPGGDIRVNPATFKYKLRYRYDHSANAYFNNGCIGGVPPSSVTFELWGNTYTSKGVNDTIQRNWTASGCATEQTLCYKVTDIVCAPTDSLPNRLKVTVRTKKHWDTTDSCGRDPDDRASWGVTEYYWHTIDAPAGDTTCADNRPALPWGDAWVESGDSCYENCIYTPSSQWTTPGKVDYYKTDWRTTNGDLRQQNPAYHGYIDKNPSAKKTYYVTPNPGYIGSSWTVKNDPVPEPDSGDGDFTLVTAANQKTTLVCTKRNTDGNCGEWGTILPNAFDHTYFRYPGKDGTFDSNGDLLSSHAIHPHGWSYKKTRLNPNWLADWRYRHRWNDSYIDVHFNNNDDRFVYVVPWGGPWGYPSNWSEAIQRPVYDSTNPNTSTYFPAFAGNDFSNYYGEDQGVFVNLPVYDQSMYNLGDDYKGSNVKRVINRVNLAIKGTYWGNGRVHTMAPGNPLSIAVNTSTAQTGNGTPLAANLRDAKKYFESYIRKDPLSLGNCRNNYIILLTDGTETTGEDPVKAAADLWNLKVDGKPVPVRVFVIGFGLGSSEKTVLNQIAAAGGPGDEFGNSAQAYFADDVDTLVSILADDIASIVTAGSYSRSKAGLPLSGGKEEDGLTIYNSYFDYPGWRGHLKASDVYLKDEYDSSGKQIARAGDIKGDAIHWGSGCGGFFSSLAPADSPNAGCIMAENNLNPDSSNRTIYTTHTVSGAVSRIVFNTANIASLKSQLLPNAGLDINNNGTPNEDADAEAVIGFVHHPGYANAKYVGTRTKEWPLADIYTSGPVVVPAPLDRGCTGIDANNDGSIDKNDPAEWNWGNMTGYCQYNQDQKNRKGVVYVSTNGGMIQAFTTGRAEVVDDRGTTDTSDDVVTVPKITGGKELWGFIPDFVLPRLHEFRIGHRFTMDLRATVAEVDTSDGLSGTLLDWKTILVAGQRKGGNNYIALDVTDPDNPQYLWSFKDNNLGETWSRPSVARIEMDGARMSVFIFGGGYSTDTDKGNRIYIVKASDGTLLKEITVGGSTNNVPGQLKTMRYLTNGVGQVIDYRTNTIEGTYGDDLGIDKDRRDFIEVAYFGDTDGNLWRLEGLNTDSGGSWNPKAIRIYQPDAAHAQAIYHIPMVVDRKTTSCVKRYILAGTGDENNPTAEKTGAGRPLINYFFEVKEDNTSGSPVNDEGMLQWRLSLGKEFPRDEYGFLLKPDGSNKYQHGGVDILSSYIFLLSAADYSATGSLWNIDSSGNLTYTKSGGSPVLAAEKGEFLFKNSTNDLYKEPGLTTLVASSGSYKVLDFSRWLTNQYGDFYNSDSNSGTVIIPASDVGKYYYDDDGFWCSSSDLAVCNTEAAKIKVDGDKVAIVSDMGEKMLTTPQGYGEQVYFMTYTPVGGCGIGNSYFYGVTASNCSKKGGSGLLTHGPGTEVYTATRKFRHAPQRRVGLGSGIADFTLGGTTAFISQGGEMNPLPIPLSQTRLKYWKQN